ncbi:TetR/AcrR family transcriptional regulator [Herbiconiux moechotypicola]|uniref:TetR/AcrR family transcriptional regulator n=1 Tax=Herbiconiux moechotypicola TaxID=637393 RepID=A0ABN3E6G7_9MICO|nr:TetR/AcrR family transcriptional regulator [Herbiconiux moechotypicola]MCS5731983.1 TetR/AcrR family transcriptional regulator [Herbiconiux moechotypicola]
MGRRRSFDETALLDRAQEQFWTNGYGDTRLEDIAAASGVGNGSIYAAYGSKLGLFLAVFGRYCDHRIELVEHAAHEAEGSFEEAVAHFLDVIVADCTSYDDLRGCLMLNSLTELGAKHPEVVAIGARANDRMEHSIGTRVQSAVADGELDLEPAEVQVLSAHILLVSQGLVNLSRLGVPAERLRALAHTSSRMSALLGAA